MRLPSTALLALSLLATGCTAAAPPSRVDTALADATAEHGALPPESKWLDPPDPEDTHVIPSGDPAARDLPDDSVDLEPAPAAPVNLHPKRRYRIHGRLPRHLSMRMASRFHAYNWHDPACKATVREEDRDHPYGWFNFPVRMRYSGDTYEGTLVIDRFADSPCRWVYQSTSIVVMRRGDPEQTIALASMPIVSADQYHLPGEEPVCVPGAYLCNPERLRKLLDAKPTPAIVRCRTDPVGSKTNFGTTPHFTCQDLNRLWKEQQLLKPWSRDIRVDVYDLDRDADPLGPSMQGTQP